MTCIVGIKEEDGKIILGGDSAGVAGLDLTVRADEKVFHRGPFMMGFTSSFRMGQLLRFSLHTPPHPEGMNNYEYMVTLFIDSVRKCLSDGGWTKKDDNRERGGTFIVSYRGDLYVVEGDFQVGIPSKNYCAVGCGESYALGSFYASEAYKTDVEFRALQALEAAQQFSAGVREPFHFIESK